jgi:UDP-2,3-diacylglucosamine pyrophosphatase LpxH
MNTPALTAPLLFLSDAHLGGFSESENERVESDLIQLLNYCQRNTIRIAILGDLFDYWMEYPQHVPQVGSRLLERFKEFNNELGPTLFITGNHDNWTRDHLAQIGFYVVDDEYVATVNGQKLMTLHGDGLSDERYNLRRPLMHRFLRDETFIKIYQQILPPRMGIGLMKYFSKITRRLDEGPQKEDKLNEWARQLLEASDLDVVLCGHDHIPRRKQFAFGTYINLGTFYHHQTMAFYNNNHISLVCWEAKKQSLTQFDTPHSS